MRRTGAEAGSEEAPDQARTVIETDARLEESEETGSEMKKGPGWSPQAFQWSLGDSNP